jgi:hypothetical protein
MSRSRTRLKKRMKYENLIVECRRQWNRFDPIGVVDPGDETDDEYHSYAARTAKLLMEGADVAKVADYVRNVLGSSLGLSDFPEDKVLEFARQLARHSA